MNQNFRNFALWAVILLLLVALFNLFQNPTGQTGAQEVTYSQFRTDTNDGKDKSVVISGQEITGKYEDGSRFRTVAPENADYVTLLEDKAVSIQARADDEKMSFLSVLISWFPMFLLIAVWICHRDCPVGGKERRQQARLQLQTDARSRGRQADEERLALYPGSGKGREEIRQTPDAKAHRARRTLPARLDQSR
jgi:ATP-dependent Zn protease